MVEIRISHNEANQRVDKYVRKYLNNAPLSFIYRLFRKKDIKVNNKRVPISYLLKEGDLLKIYVNESQINDFHAQKVIKETPLKEDLVYEDDNILIVNKSKGLLVHGDYKEKKITLTNQVLNYLNAKGEYDPSTMIGFTPSPSHRLDRNTSGLIIFAKNLITQQEIEKALQKREGIRRFYLCLVSGVLLENITIDQAIKKEETKRSGALSKIDNKGKQAITKVKVIEHFENYSLLEVEIITGRTHQIRTHLQLINHPLVGDKKYGHAQVNRYFKNTFNYEYQFLHAYRLIFTNLQGHLIYLNNKTFESPLPKLEKEIVKLL